MRRNPAGRLSGDGLSRCDDVGEITVCAGFARVAGTGGRNACAVEADSQATHDAASIPNPALSKDFNAEPT